MLRLVHFEVLVTVSIPNVFELLKVVLGCLADWAGSNDNVVFERMVLFARGVCRTLAAIFDCFKRLSTTFEIRQLGNLVCKLPRHW